MPSQAPTSSKPVSSTAPSDGSADIRRSRVYLLSRGPLSGLLRRAVSIVALVAADIAGLALGVYVALVLRSLVYGDTVYWSLLWDTGPAEWLPFLAPITVLVFLQAGLYAPRERRAGSGRILAALVLVALIVLAFGLGTDYDFTTTGLIPTAVATSALAIGLLRAAYDSVSLELMGLAGVRRRLVLVGEGHTLTDLERQLRAARGGIGVDVVGTLNAGRGPSMLGSSLDRLVHMLERERPDELVLAEADFDEQTVLGVVQLAHRHGVKVKLAPTTTELLVHEGQYVPGQGVPLFELRPPMLTGVEWATKRAFDLVVSLVFAVVGIPLWLLVAAAIKLDSRGPVLYVDRRVGVGEREFGMFKFRTMVADAAEQQPELEEENEATGALFKIRDDPRVTRVGRVLRRLSLDELPQLVNVLRGEMSLVGPRPLPLRDHAMLEDWHRARALVLPGMTGLWQISGRSGLEFDDLVRLDFTYIENWSIWSDVSIIARTIPAVLSGRGAY
ncbi:MAG TPA: sugar transferase [Gaiella sp.]|uniref:sugar transferase n=1 Tax=Gaiella sp. TaxID=2663207 RepID=UPI002D7EA4BE|nr:sugar transferase [Gaiella sp.]HET9287425.1 sugar transferase [Gaiella sp.]